MLRYIRRAVRASKKKQVISLRSDEAVWNSLMIASLAEYSTKRDRSRFCLVCWNEAFSVSATVSSSLLCESNWCENKLEKKTMTNAKRLWLASSSPGDYYY